jgi:hypothetical protein
MSHVEGTAERGCERPRNALCLEGQYHHSTYSVRWSSTHYQSVGGRHCLPTKRSSSPLKEISMSLVNGTSPSGQVLADIFRASGAVPENPRASLLCTVETPCTTLVGSLIATLRRWLRRIKAGHRSEDPSFWSGSPRNETAAGKAFSLQGGGPPLVDHSDSL